MCHSLDFPSVKNSNLIAYLLFTLFVGLISIYSHTATASQLVRGESDSAVYYIYNGKRYAFPNEKIYFSWYSDFSDVATVTDIDLAAIPLAGNVTYRPGIKMVKVTTDPKVYAVASNSTLRWIASEELAKIFYGDNWNRLIDDVPDAFFTNYNIGQPINDINEYNIALETSANQTFIPPTIIESRLPPQPIASNVITEYLTCLSPSEQAEINADFNIKTKYPPASTWSNASYICDFSSNEPSALGIFNTLRFIKNIDFTKPLPFTDTKTLYEFLRLETLPPAIRAASSGRLDIFLHPGCDMFSSGGNNLSAYKQNNEVMPEFIVNLNGHLSRIYPSISSPLCEDAGVPADSLFVLNGRYKHPINSAELLIHEAYHAIKDEPHDGPNGSDKSIDQSGAWAAQFYFNAWVALYATNVDMATKEIAKFSANDIFHSRFSEQKCPLDTALKDVVNQVVPDACP